jgi:hypothetical protein
VVIVGLDQARTGRISLYPNPCTDVLTISRTGPDAEIRFEILNTIGQPVYRGVLLDQTQVPTGGLAAGVYWVRFTDGSTYKLLK